MVMEGIQEDIGEGNMQCINHPYKNNSSPGGICALCLQEKLGKLVSNSFSSTVFPSSRSDFAATTSTLQPPTNNKNATDCITNYHHPYDNTMRKSRMQFLLTQKKKKNHSSSNGGVVPSSGSDSGIVFKRSKSTTTPRNHLHFLDGDDAENYGPHRKGFWSFLNYSSTKHYSSTGSSLNGSTRSREKKKEDFAIVEQSQESPNDEAAASSDRKVARSRSVGCGSRSFSGDFFEKISTGLGDCTLRRIESQREGKPRFPPVHHNKERVINCGGIFSGFMITENLNGKPHSLRSKNWGWALASPMRAFSKTSSSSSGKRENSSNKNAAATPNLAAIPSLLTVSS